MELRDFVKSTLLDVVAGIAEAQAECRRLGNDAYIASRPVTGGPSPRVPIMGLAKDRLREPVDINFDVALVATEKGGMDGGVGLNVHVASFKYGASDTREASMTHHIKFSVPVILPDGSPSPEVGEE